MKINMEKLQARIKLHSALRDLLQLSLEYPDLLRREKDSILLVLQEIEPEVHKASEFEVAPKLESRHIPYEHEVVRGPQFVATKALTD